MSTELKIATFNVEWMVNLFENGKPILSTRQNKRAPGLGSLLHSVVHELRGAFQHDIALMRDVLSAAQLNKKTVTWTAGSASCRGAARST